jgi:hypothetical protein
LLKSAFSAVACARFQQNALARNAEAFPQRKDEIGLAGPAEETAGPAAIDEPRRWITPRQFGNRSHALGGLVDRWLPAHSRDVRADRAAEHDDAVGRAARGIPFRKALL